MKQWPQEVGPIRPSDDVEGSCFGGEAASETVYGWTAPSTGEFCFDLIDSTYDTSLAVFDEYCDEELACDEDGHGVDGWFTSYVTVSLTEGDTVSVVVDAWSSSTTGDHTLHINEGACGL